LAPKPFNHVAVVATISLPRPNSTLPPVVTVKDAETGDVEYTVQPYENWFHGGVNVAVGDLNCDGIPDLVVAPQQGHTPLVKLFNGSPDANGNYPRRLLNSFMAFNQNFLGGLSVALGDVNGDDNNDLVVGGGPGGPPAIKVFDGQTILNPTPSLIGRPFDAFSSAYHEAIDQNFAGGVNVAVGDLNNDGYADIVATVASSGPPIANVFNGNGFGFLRGFNAFSATNSPSGLSVAIGDVTGDGVRDIIFGPGPGWIPEVAIISGATLFTAAKVRPFKMFPVAGPTAGGAVLVEAEPANGGNPGSVELDRLFVEVFPRVLSGVVANPTYETYSFLSSS
jgi:hypothetical protein